ncbi:unnamed protein product [Paramecium octaurelia]|uniref:Uncharacterized protein n=1 Tax=Paramecium octaurelia TaxID=43137 RepID=A0A8S1X8C1_PAROT|nr:unnamed protein product [Paramecium octaurelia]
MLVQSRQKVKLMKSIRNLKVQMAFLELIQQSILLLEIFDTYNIHTHNLQSNILQQLMLIYNYQSHFFIIIAYLI